MRATAPAHISRDTRAFAGCYHSAWTFLLKSALDTIYRQTGPVWGIAAAVIHPV